MERGRTVDGWRGRRNAGEVTRGSLEEGGPGGLPHLQKGQPPHSLVGCWERRGKTEGEEVNQGQHIPGASPGTGPEAVF